MIISTQTDSLARAFGEEEAIKILAENGYDAIDYSMFYMTDKNDKRYKEDGYDSYIKDLKAVSDKYKIPFNQTHTPFPTYIEGNNEYNEWIFKLIIDSIRYSALLGARYAIVHPNHVSENIFEKNMEFYKSLLPYAKEYNVIICLENMFGWKDGAAFPTACGTADDFVKYLDTLNSEYFKACLDLGHAGISGQSVTDMIHALGHERLKALHVHDNDNVYDLHTLPFTGKINWTSVMCALKEIDYTGEFTFEADSYIAKMPTELKKEASAFMLKVGKFLTGVK